MSMFTTAPRRILTACCAVAILALGVAHAQPGSSVISPSAAVTTSADLQLTIRDIYDRVEAAGYRDIREIEWDDGRYEVKAHNADGERVKLHVDGNTGALEPIRKRDHSPEQ